MANKQIEMRKVKKIFKLYTSGVSKRQISSQLGVSRNTVTKYIDFFGFASVYFQTIKIQQNFYL